jgi:hypothetical protein
MEAIIDAIPDIMIEVGLDGNFVYNYHSIAKDSFIMATDSCRAENLRNSASAAAA